MANYIFCKNDWFSLSMSQLDYYLGIITYVKCTLMHFNGIGVAVLRDHDYIKLQFMGAKDVWLGYGLDNCPRKEFCK